MDVEEKFRNIIKMYLRESKGDKSNFWERVFEIVGKNAVFVFKENNLNKLRHILVDNLLSYDSDDFTTVKRVMDICALGMGWRLICKRDRRMLFCGILNPSYELNRMHKRCTLSGLKLFDFAMAFSEVDLVTVLVKYGLFQVPSGNCIIFHDISEAERLLKEFFDITVPFVLNPEVIDMRMYRRHLAKMIVNWLRKSKFRRIQLFLRILDAIAYGNRYFHADDCVKCIKLFFETVPDPFLTKAEVNLFLRCLFCYESFHDAADSLTEDYVQLFPTEALGPLQPRRLMHLCRCSIRQAIFKTSNFLPKVVADLHLPSSLKSYILIECGVRRIESPF